MPDIRKAYRRWQYDIMLDKLDEERRTAAIEEQKEQYGAKKKDEGKAEGKAEGIAEGREKRDMEIAIKAFSSLKSDGNIQTIVETLKTLDIPDSVIEAARKQAEVEL